MPYDFFSPSGMRTGGTQDINRRRVAGRPNPLSGRQATPFTARGSIPGASRVQSSTQRAADPLRASGRSSAKLAQQYRSGERTPWRSSNVIDTGGGGYHSSAVSTEFGSGNDEVSRVDPVTGNRTTDITDPIGNVITSVQGPTGKNISLTTRGPWSGTTGSGGGNGKGKTPIVGDDGKRDREQEVSDAGDELVRKTGIDDAVIRANPFATEGEYGGYRSQGLNERDYLRNTGRHGVSGLFDVGLSDKDKALFRARANTAVPSLADVLYREDARTGGGRSAGVIGRDFGRLTGEQRLNTEAELADIVNSLKTGNMQRRQAALSQLIGLYGSEHGPTADTRRALLGSAAINAGGKSGWDIFKDILGIGAGSAVGFFGGRN